MARHLINLVGGRLIRANEIELAKVDGTWEVVGVDPTAGRCCAVCCPVGWAGGVKPGTLVDWESIEPFVAHVPTARLRIPYRKLARLHPAQIADLVEAASHEEGEEIIKAVGPTGNSRRTSSRSSTRSTRWNSSGPLGHRGGATARVDGARRRGRPDHGARPGTAAARSSKLLPEPQQRKVRSLLSYNPETAGGPDEPGLPRACPTHDRWPRCSAAVRASTAPPEALQVVFASDEGNVPGRPRWSRWSRPPPGPLAARSFEPESGPRPRRLGPRFHGPQDVGLQPDVAPVMDEHHTMLGVVTVDDVLELLLPTGPPGLRRDRGGGLTGPGA